MNDIQAADNYLAGFGQRVPQFIAGIICVVNRFYQIPTLGVNSNSALRGKSVKFDLILLAVCAKLQCTCLDMIGIGHHPYIRQFR